VITHAGPQAITHMATRYIHALPPATFSGTRLDFPAIHFSNPEEAHAGYILEHVTEWDICLLR
jgi:hypothetical protein